MSIFDIIFQEKWWLYSSLPILAITGWLFYHGYRRRSAILNSVIAPRLKIPFTQQISGPRRSLKRILLMIAVLLLVLAIARPQLGYIWEEQPEQTTDILFALDTSRSMLAPDLQPNRLFRAKLAVEDLVQELEAVRIGLIPFAGDAFLWCPLTYDRAAFIDTLRDIDTTIIPSGGTNLLSAVETAENAFPEDLNTTKIMVLITDGENLAGSIENRLTGIAQRGWTIHTIGIGTEEGELIPITKEDGSTGFVTDAEGNIVKTKLDEATLKLIAEKTGGSYQNLGTTGEGLNELFENYIRPGLETRESARLRKIPIDRYRWLVFVIIGLLIFELFLNDRRSSAKLKQNFSTTLVASIFFLGFSLTEIDASTQRKAQKAFDEGIYDKAESLYLEAAPKSPKDHVFSYNAGVSALNAGNYESAKNALTQSTLSEDLSIQGKSYFNLGNTHYQLGHQVLDSQPQETVKAWEASIENYESCLALDPENVDAIKNRDEVKRLLEKLKELLQQQNQDQQNSDDNQQQDQNQQNDQQNQDSSSQDNQSSEDQNQEQQNSDQSQQNQNENQQEQNSEQQPEPSGSEENEAESSPENDQENSEQKQDQEKPQPQEQESDQKESQKPAPQKQEQVPQPKPTAASEAEKEAQKEEALRLLESLKDEDGDFKELYFKLQNPETQEQTDKDW